MADKLKLEMVTPYKRVLSEEVDEVTAPGTIGEFGVLPDHTSLLTTLKVGELTYQKDGETFYVAVNWGYVEVEDNVFLGPSMGNLGKKGGGVQTRKTPCIHTSGNSQFVKRPYLGQKVILCNTLL